MRVAGTFCYFCGKAGYAGTSCATCSIALPDPRAPEPEADGKKCPRCAAQVLEPLPLNAVTGSACHQCGHCHGLLVTARSWCELVSNPGAAIAFAERMPARKAPPAELLAMLACPVCARQMERGRFAASSDVVVDVCTMHGMWLDAGELVDVVKHASHRAASVTAPADVQAHVDALRFQIAALGQETRMAALDRAAAGSAAEQSKRSRSMLWLVLILLSLIGSLAGLKAFKSSRAQIEDATKAATSAREQIE
jgi:Zn-finger nucleic acid-binding protein